MVIVNIMPVLAAFCHPPHIYLLCSHYAAMGATMEVRYVLLSVKMPIESTKKLANFTYWVLAHTTPHKNHFR
jgi:hypothetical protein